MLFQIYSRYPAHLKQYIRLHSTTATLMELVQLLFSFSFKMVLKSQFCDFSHKYCILNTKKTRNVSYQVYFYSYRYLSDYKSPPNDRQLHAILVLSVCPRSLRSIPFSPSPPLSPISGHSLCITSVFDNPDTITRRMGRTTHRRRVGMGTAELHKFEYMAKDARLQHHS